MTRSELPSPVEPPHDDPEPRTHRARDPLAWLSTRGFRLLFIVDAVGLFATMVVITFVRFGWPWPTYPMSHYMVGFSLATAICVTVGYSAGLYERELRLGERPWFPRVVVVMAISLGVVGLVTVLLGRYLMPRINLLLLLIVGALVLTLNRAVSRHLTNVHHGPSRVLLVGQRHAVQSARRQIELAEPCAVVVGESDTTANLFALVRQEAATDVLLLDLAAFESAFPEPLISLDREAVGVHQRVSAQETLLGLRSVRQIAGMPFTRVRTHALANHQMRLKRAFDLVVVLVTLPLTIPAISGLAAYLRIRAGSPVLYRQRRVGRDGRIFEVLKFRTMRVDAEAAGPQLADHLDPRVVRGVGWMRSCRADELPQLWNVVRGEMSLVGPRPERPEFVTIIESEVPSYARRHEVSPGLTGLAQVYGRYDSLADHKLGYDLQYLVNWSLLLDLQILARTIWVVISRRV